MSLDLTKHPGLSRSLPFALFVLVLAVELSWNTLQVMVHALHSLDKRWLYGIKSGLAALALIFLWGRFEELKQAPRQVGAWVMALVAGVGIFVLWINLTQPWTLLGEMGMGFAPYSADGQTDWLLAGIRLAGSALVVPIIEELFWRSFIMRWIDKPDFLSLDPRNVSHRGLVISSALFAVEHTQWLAGFLAGIAYGWLYRRTGNIWLSILAHATTNAMLGLWVLNTESWQFW
ncbi:MAG TPA: CAAX prenyl protease-related protein [Thiobacillaceae bacterium]|nr:CAAX prenyl protease-related protein [Thiobacillaceae bacterium]